MSAVAGIIEFAGVAPSLESIVSMTTAMQHRGPDGVRHRSFDGATLGHCAFDTTPEAGEVRQPFSFDEGGHTLVMDGRIDNRIELRQLLESKGAALRGSSDEELLLKSFEIWGEHCPEHIIGEFVFLIWDPRRRTLFGARDAVGARHFYFYRGAGWFAFASEIRGLLALEEIPRRLNENRLLDYLVSNYDRVEQVETFFQGIARLPAGHAMKVDRSGAQTWRYWKPGNLPVLAFPTLNDCAEAFSDVLEKAIASRLRSRGPVGAMLSGGLDSSAIVGLVCKRLRNEKSKTQAFLHTYSMVLDDREACKDGQAVALMLADRKISTYLKPEIIDASWGQRNAKDYLGSLANTDEPFRHTHGIGYDVTYGAASRSGCSVLLDGMAGDLLFYGFSRSMAEVVGKSNFSLLPSLLRSYKIHGIRRRELDLLRVAMTQMAPWARPTYRRLVHEREDRRGQLQMLPKKVARPYLERIREGLERDARKPQDTDQQAHARVFCSGAISFAHEIYGQIAFGHGVEPRSPFSDRRVVEFAIQMPLEAKLALPMYKQLLRLSASKVIPPAVSGRRDLGGHPGWRFYERTINESLEGLPYFWEEVVSLDSWIDRSWGNNHNRPNPGWDYSRKYESYKLAALRQWLHTHL